MRRSFATRISGLLLVSFLVLLVGASTAPSQSWRPAADSAQIFHRAGRNDIGVQYLTRALNIAASVPETHDTTLANLLSLISAFNWFDGHLQPAYAAIDSALRIYERVQDPPRTWLASAVLRKGTCLWDLGRYAEAEPLIRRAVSLREQWFGRDNDETQRARWNLAGLLQESGKIAAAEQVYAQLIAVRERLGIPVGDMEACNLGNFFTALGRYDQAESLLVQRIRLSAPPHPSPFVLSSLGSLYQETGRLAQAIPVHEEAVAAFDSLEFKDNPDNPLLGYFRIQLGQLYAQARRSAEAESVILAGLKILERTGLTNFISALPGLRTLASIALARGDTLRAEEYLHRAEHGVITTLGYEHPEMVNVRLAIAHLRAAQHRDPDALEETEKAASLALRIAARGIEGMTEPEALQYLQTLQGSTRELIAAATASGALVPLPPTVVRTIVASKGIVSESFLRRARAMSASNRRQPDRIRDSLHVLQRALARAYARGEVSASSDVDRLSRVVDSMETLLARTREIRSEDAADPAWTIDDLVSALPPHAAVIDLFVVDPPRGERRYAALVIDARGATTMVDLGSGNTIDAAIAAYHSCMEQLAATSGAGREKMLNLLGTRTAALSALIWRPLEPVVGSTRTLFVAPDGMLHLVPFSGLVDTDDAYLIERFRIHHLDAGRDLLRWKVRARVPDQRLLALGDPDFDAMPAGAKRPSSGLRSPDAGEQEGATPVRSIFDGTLNSAVQRLPGTAAEVQTIAGRDRNAVVLTGRRASEENFKRLAPQFGRIHVATHGFSILDGPKTPSGIRRTVENPLLHSGLFLSGANRRRDAMRSAGGEDGVLTALEVAGLDLQNVGIVVLSACETGVGEVETGEGVYDLRRAFHAAGVKTVVSTLWKVADLETAAFFHAFYSSHGTDYPERLRIAALARIREARQRGRTVDPSVWAAFTATGEWRLPR